MNNSPEVTWIVVEKLAFGSKLSSSRPLILNQDNTISHGYQKD